MEHNEDIRSDLESLRKLYGHLQSLKVGSQSASQCELDDKALMLFKDLLDGACERMFGAHSEFMAAQFDVSESPNTILLNLKDRPMAIPHLPEPVPIFSQKFTCNSVTAEGEEQKPALVFSSEKLNPDNHNPKPAKKRKYCRIPRKIHSERSNYNETQKDNTQKALNLFHQKLNESSPSHWNNIQQQNIILDDTNTVKNAQSFDGSISVSGNEGVAKSEPGSDIIRKFVKKTEETESMLSQIASTTDIIDSHILSLKSAAVPVIKEESTVNHAEVTQAQKLIVVNDDMQSKQANRNIRGYKDMNLVSCCNTIKPVQTRSLGTDTKLREIIGKTLSTSLTNNSKEDRLEFREPPKDNEMAQNVKAMVQKIESMSRLSIQNEPTLGNGCKYVRGMRVSASPSNEFQNQLLRPQNELSAGTSLSSMPNRTWNSYIASPILYGTGIGKKQGRTPEDNKSNTNRKIVSPHRHDLKFASSSSAASSRWRSQQASTSNSNSEECSLPDTQSDGYVEPTDLSDSGSDSFLSETGDYRNGSSSSSYGDADLSESTDQQNVDPEGYSESISAGSVSNNRSSDLIKVKKQTGRLKKLKDKLGLIFHHHHHHHHHHHEHGDKATRGTSLWKTAGKIFNGKGKTEKHREKAAEKVARTLIQRVPKKNQNGNFNSLVKGALKHVKNSKSPKLPKVDVKRSTSHHGGKSGGQKLHWWRMLQQQQRAVKMPRRTKVKLDLGTKEPHLLALPNSMSDNGEG